MLKTDIIHPELLRGLAMAGHGARILVADGNYPVTVKSSLNAEMVFLNFVPGAIDGVSVISALAKTIPIESAMYMTPESGEMPAIVGQYQSIINIAGKRTPFTPLGRFEFYEEASSPDTALVIATGEQRVYANLLLVVGVQAPE